MKERPLPGTHLSVLTTRNPAEAALHPHAGTHPYKSRRSSWIGRDTHSYKCLAADQAFRSTLDSTRSHLLTLAHDVNKVSIPAFRSLYVSHHSVRFTSLVATVYCPIHLSSPAPPTPAHLFFKEMTRGTGSGAVFFSG